MGLFLWSEKKIQKMSIWDFALVKCVLVLLGIIIGAYISTFVKQYVSYLIIVFIVLYVLLMYQVFRK